MTDTPLRAANYVHVSRTRETEPPAAQLAAIEQYLTKARRPSLRQRFRSVCSDIVDGVDNFFLRW